MHSSKGQYCGGQQYVTTPSRVLFQDKSSIKMQVVLRFEIR